MKDCTPSTTVVHAILFWVLIIIVMFPISGHTQNFFTISGNVLDSETKMSLPGATVVVEGTTQGTATDANGNFILRNVKRGQVAITITFIGFETLTLPLEIKNTTTLPSILLMPSVTGLSEIVISGNLEGQQKALNQQRSADNIKNIISSDLIGRFPDLNVAEALQRVPGINIQRDKGEGSTISIRGTPQNFTTVQINGEQMPSVQQDGSRNEALDLIPADQLSSMEITKAPTPDMDGDAIGGVVNLKTPTANNSELGARAETGIGYNDISGGFNGIGRLRLDKRFLTKDVARGKLGVMVGLSYYATDNSEDRTDAAWRGLPVSVQSTGGNEIVMQRYEFRRTENNRERIGATATIDYKFNSKSQIIFNYMYNRREDNDLRNRLRYDFDRSGSTWVSYDTIRQSRVRRDINIWDEVKSNQSFNFQGFHSLNQWQIDWGAYYTASERMYSSIRGDFSRDEIDIVTENRSGIFTDVPQFRMLNPTQDVHNPLLLNDFRRFEDDFETTNATNVVLKTDISKSLLLNGKHDVLIKFGGKLRSQSNSKFRNNVVYGFFDPNNVLNRTEAFARVIGDFEPAAFLNDQYRFGPRVVRDRFESYIDEARPLLVVADDAWDSRRLSLSDTYDAFEDIYAGYAMARIQLNKLMILAGLRYEQNNVRYDAFEVERRGTDVEGTPITGGNNYRFLLPNIHLKYRLTEFSNLRFATAFNYARPNFNNIVPFVNYDADAIRLNLGNPDLQPASAYNIDLMYEYYFANVGIVSVGGFYKNIDNFQFTRIVPALTEDFPGYPGTTGFEFRQEQNGENAVVAGVEVNVITQLDFLPSILKNFGVNFNYTWAYSDAFTQDRTGISLPGQAQHTWNGALTYDLKKFSGRVSFNYNGAFVNSVASQLQDDIIQEERLQIDANVSWSFSKRWRIFGEFINITNAPSIRYQGERERIARIAYFGWWTRAGISFRI